MTDFSASIGRKPMHAQEVETQTVSKRKQGFRFSRLLSGCLGRRDASAT
jgi:hypothetical protein